MGRDKTINDKPLDGDTPLRGSSGGRSHGARKRKLIAEASAGKAQVERERDELREALEILEDKFGSGTRPYDSEDGDMPSRERNSNTGASLCVCGGNDTQPQEHHEVVHLDAEETLAERVANFFALQAGPS